MTEVVQDYFAEQGGKLPPNLRPYSGVASLPTGSILKIDHPENRYPLDVLVEEVVTNLQISLKDPAINYYLQNSGLSRNTRGLRFGSLVAGLSSGNKNSFKIAKEMSVAEPGLAWMRGGSLVISEGLAVLDHSGCDGLVGGDVERYARYDYNGAVRLNPVIFRIGWKDMVEAIESRLIHPGTHHMYDMSPFVNIQSEEMMSWQKEHLVVYKLVK